MNVLIYNYCCLSAINQYPNVLLVTLFGGMNATLKELQCGYQQKSPA
jgi:hypothetical protein